jgi:hypothetical protein
MNESLKKSVAEMGYSVHETSAMYRGASVTFEDAKLLNDFLGFKLARDQYLETLTPTACILHETGITDFTELSEYNVIVHIPGIMDQPLHAPHNAYNAGEIFKRNARLLKERFNL